MHVRLTCTLLSLSAYLLIPIPSRGTTQEYVPEPRHRQLDGDLGGGGVCFDNRCQDDPSYRSILGLSCADHHGLLPSDENCYSNWNETGGQIRVHPFVSFKVTEDELLAMVQACPCACNMDCGVMYSPSASPTVATAGPGFYEWNTLSEPNNPGDTYFNYSPRSQSEYGPDSWGSISGTEEKQYWNLYKDWIEPDLERNFCNSGSDRQSPIDLNFDIVNGECLEYHQIKHHSGTAKLDDESNVRFEIHPSKLRMNYLWKPRAMDKKNPEKFLQPSADMPKGWGIHLPVLHIDLKIPSEHTFNGKRYAAEYQIWLIQHRDTKRGAPVVSVLLDLHPDDKDNQPLQDILDRFQLLWNADYNECNEHKKENKRDLTREEIEAVRRKRSPSRDHRGLRHKTGVFDPWHEDLIRSPWFFGYMGSLTEPPCTPFVEWRIIDLPALISRDQLMQMQNLLFGHVNGNCRLTSVHHDGSVARPLQPNLNRTVHKCMCRNYLDNDDRAWYGHKKCQEGDEHIFHERDAEGNWITMPKTMPNKKAAGLWN